MWIYGLLGRLIHVMDVLFVFRIYFSVGLYSQIEIFMTKKWCKAWIKIFHGVSEFSEGSENTLIFVLGM